MFLTTTPMLALYIVTTLGRGTGIRPIPLLLNRSHVTSGYRSKRVQAAVTAMLSRYVVIETL